MSNRHRILLVDDEENLLLGLKRSLRNEPYDIETRTSPTGALELVSAGGIDVVVSDQRMPGMCGTRLLTEARKRAPDTVRIMLTGLANFETALEAINSGEVFRFLTKPCDPRELAATLKVAITHRQLLLEARRLLATVRRQSDVMDELEGRFPGIAFVRQTEDGAILIEEDDLSEVEQLIHQAQSEIQRAVLALAR